MYPLQGWDRTVDKELQYRPQHPDSKLLDSYHTKYKFNILGKTSYHPNKDGRCVLFVQVDRASHRFCELCSSSKEEERQENERKRGVKREGEGEEGGTNHEKYDEKEKGEDGGAVG